MDLRQISYFVALFEEGSVTRAAQRVHVVQPALSMQIAKLERELEQRLFERRPKVMEPTAAGRTLYRLVQPILRDLAQARTQMKQLSKTVSGRVSIGMLASLTSSIVPAALARFTQAYPQVEVSIADGYTTTFIEAVSARELDVAIINKPPRKIGLVTQPFVDEEMVVIGKRETALPVAKPISMRDLAQLDLILPSRRHGLRVELERYLAAEEVTVTPKLELDLVPAIADFVAGSRLFTILPSIAVNRQLMDGSLKAYRIVTPRITRQLVVIHHPGQPMSAAAGKLLQILRQELADASTQLQKHIIGTD
jgi:LysR family transcriptional regulator, nitrogen assimilation regulatory protein